jgi:LysM repeat protein
MKKIILITLISLLFVSTITSQIKNKAYVSYIETYAQLAIEQQILHKIPASIKLAQGLLESGAGNGTLAVNSNNHFGIKCNGWTGKTAYADDDVKNECFRMYDSVRESYEDHSQFLITRPRYASLFQLEATDYKGWAFGLKSAGYATDANYAHKLIKLIEDYELTQFDGKTAIKQRNNTFKTDSKTTLRGHDLYRNNKVKCVFSEAGDSYFSIAKEFNISEKKILKYNDLTAAVPLQPGTIVYIGQKKKKADKEFTTHTVQEGENTYRISQKYGIKLQSLYDMNNLPYTQGAEINMELKLR